MIMTCNGTSNSLQCCTKVPVAVSGSKLQVCVCALFNKASLVHANNGGDTYWQTLA